MLSVRVQSIGRGTQASMLYSLVIVQVLLLLSHGAAAADSTKDRCSTCKGLVDNFNEGLKKTAKSNFGGGNTHWEEKALGSYAFSETRLLEVLETACTDSNKGCHHMVEEQEDTIEHWWFKFYAKGEQTDLRVYLCIDKIQVCCPEGRYGKDCRDCPGGATRPCLGSGACDGVGTREGTGECRCDAGYTGATCDECKDEGFYEESKNDTHVSCKECHAACKTGCESAGPEGCEDCKDGWDYSDSTGCTDVDECSAEEGPCEANTFCLNTEGSHKCEACDSACDGCSAVGADHCVQCKDKFYKDGEMCRACHYSCAGSCTDDTALSCDACQDGYDRSEQEGCVDVNECEASAAPCQEDEHCVNTEGSFRCSTCHSACVGCTGSGSALCNECKEGYKRNEENVCADVDECETNDKCPGEKETCKNTVGSHQCDCVEGYARDQGQCVAKPQPKPEKKVKKKKKTKAAVNPILQCETCRDMANRFAEGLKRTDKSNFGGGNTRWEEKSLGTYAFSEERLTDILEDVCPDDDKKCNALVENKEAAIEHWWTKVHPEDPSSSLLEYLCISKMKVCCANGTAGPVCSDCQGGREHPCTDNGECQGNSYRVGNGECNCTEGYRGRACDECKLGYYEHSKNKTSIICKGCDTACKSSCWGEGPAGCDDCDDGWLHDLDTGCIDVDECSGDEGVCESGHFCLNTPGSYTCKVCDYACTECRGVGPDMCTHCKPRYYRDKDSTCRVCHPACESACTDGTAHSCDRCKAGYDMSATYGCVECHVSCAGCTGPGSADCRECSHGYAKNKDNICADIDECSLAETCPGEHEVCENNRGSYRCLCGEGYVRELDQCLPTLDTLSGDKPVTNSPEKLDILKEMEKMEPAAMVDSEEDMVVMEGSFSSPPGGDTRHRSHSPDGATTDGSQSSEGAELESDKKQTAGEETRAKKSRQEL